MKTLIATALLFFGSPLALSESPFPPNDKGWMAFFVGDACQLGRQVAGQGERRSELAIAFLRNPHDGHPPAEGQTMLSVSLFREGKPHTDPARSLTVIAGQKQWKLTPSEFGMNYIVGEQADAARASFLTEPVTVQAAESDGNSKTFVVTPKGFKVANATFNACVAELLLDKPARPATR
jgi:hypothetical protein